MKRGAGSSIDEMSVDPDRNLAFFETSGVAPSWREASISPNLSQVATADAKSSRDSRASDVTGAILLLILVLPLMIICAVAVGLSGPGGVVYRQTRIGRNGCEFTCLKFRTMAPGADHAIDRLLDQSAQSRDEWAALFKLRTDPRVTIVGRFLRRYSLDELPQLINVLRGDMSLVGPRPIVADEINRYGPYFADYCRVKPGLTGLWQVSGRHDMPYSDRVQLDAQYANSKSLRLDLIILWRTVPIVLFGQND